MKRRFSDQQAAIAAEIISKETGKQYNVSLFLCLSSTFSVLFETENGEQKILTENKILNMSSGGWCGGGE